MPQRRDITRATTRIEGDGGEVYRARSGRVIAAISAENVGNGFVRIATPVTGLTIQDIAIDNVYRVIENSAGVKGEDASVRRLLVRRITATNVRRGFARIRYDSADGSIADVTAGGVIATAPHDLPVGIAFDDTAHGFRVERCVMRGFRWQRGEKQYWNGDGFSAERGNHNLVFNRCAAWDNSDGGFDLKSSDTRLEDCVAGRNARNYRLWNTIQATRLTSIDPVKLGGIGDTTHVSLMGPKPTGGGGAPQPIVISIDHLVVRSEKGWPVFHVQDGPVRIIVGSHDIQVPPKTPLVRTASGGTVPGGIEWRSGAPRI